MPTNGSSGSGMQKFGSARLAAGRRPPSVRLSKCFCGRLQIVPKAPSVKESEHSARRGPPNSRGENKIFPYQRLFWEFPANSQMPTNGSSGSVCRNASVDGFRLFQRLRLSKNQSILPGGDRRTAAGRSTVFHVARRISHRAGIPDADERFVRVRVFQ